MPRSASGQFPGQFSGIIPCFLEDTNCLNKRTCKLATILYVLCMHTCFAYTCFVTIYVCLWDFNMVCSDENVMVIVENKLRSFRIGKHTDMSPKTTVMMSLVCGSQL